MIYRIAIYKDSKFDHYAAPEEMETLRVNADGEVDALDAAIYKSDFANKDGIPFDIGEWAAEDEYYHGIIMGQWTNVSDTHKVEWGVYDPLADPQKCRIYEYDIVRDCGGRVRGMTDIKDIMYCMSEATISTEAVFGNLHTYPEPLEGAAR